MYEASMMHMWYQYWNPALTSGIFNLLRLPKDGYMFTYGLIANELLIKFPVNDFCKMTLYRLFESGDVKGSVKNTLETLPGVLETGYKIWPFAKVF